MLRASYIALRTQVARENIHSVLMMSKYLTTEHQLLLEELSVGLYHDRYSGSFLSDVIPGQVDKDAVLVCVNKGIMEATIALQWIKTTRTKKSVRITNQQAPISAEKNKRKVNEVSMNSPGRLCPKMIGGCYLGHKHRDLRLRMTFLLLP